jgi:hypothetical protein
MWITFIIIFLIIVICLFLLHLINEKKIESFSNKKDLNLLHDFNNRMEYDGIVLKPEGDSNWRHSPSNVDYYDGDTLYTPQGHTINNDPQNNGVVGINKYGPPIDSTENAQRSMFTFAFNKCSPECCPSTFSCDGGCVCTTEKQRQFINQRGIMGDQKYTNVF